MPEKRFIFVINPSSGRCRGLEVLQQVRPVFAKARLEVHKTTHAGHAAELASTQDLSNYDGLCVIGGDGTLHEVVSGLMKRKTRVSIPIGIIPGGTGNSVAQHLDYKDPVNAAQRIMAGKTQPLDVARVLIDNQVNFSVNIVGWGAAVDINLIAERLRALGPPRYALATMIHILRAQKRRARIIIDGEVIQDNFLLVAACNTRFTGKGMELAPEADSNDGKLDLILVRHATRVQMLTLFQKVFDGSHLTLPYVEHLQIQSLRIEPETIDYLNLDGEIKGTTPVSVDMIPGALKVFV